MGLANGERPDFVLARAGDQTGIEATEAIQADHARIDALRNIKGFTEPRLCHRIRADESPKPLVEIEAIARGDVDSAGWVGDSVERDWADALQYVIRKKVERFEQPGFRKFPAWGMKKPPSDMKSLLFRPQCTRTRMYLHLGETRREHTKRRETRKP